MLQVVLQATSTSAQICFVKPSARLLLAVRKGQEGLEAKVAKVLEDVVKSLAFMLQELAGTFSDFN